MAEPYWLLYRLGFTPWDGAGDPAPVLRLAGSGPAGRALDLGCGTGHHAVLLAEQGWQVTAVDRIGRALRTARERVAAAGPAGERIRLVQGDVTDLPSVLEPQPFDLVLDVGCFHGLGEAGRRAYLAGLRHYTAPGTRLLMLAVVPRRGIGPRGLDEAGLRAAAGPDWSLDDVRGAGPVNARSPLGRAPFHWFTLTRTAARVSAPRTV